MKLLGKVGLVALGMGLGVATGATILKVLKYDVVKNEEAELKATTVNVDVVVDKEAKVEEVIVTEELNNETKENK